MTSFNDGISFCPRRFGFLWRAHYWVIDGITETGFDSLHGGEGYVYWKCTKCPATKKEFVSPGP